MIPQLPVSGPSKEEFGSVICLASERLSTLIMPSPQSLGLFGQPFGMLVKNSHVRPFYKCGWKENIRQGQRLVKVSW